MRADAVAVRARVDGADDRAALARGRGAPADREARRPGLPGCEVRRMWLSRFGFVIGFSVVLRAWPCPKTGSHFGIKRFGAMRRPQKQ